MFETIDDIYNHIGQAMFNALPGTWNKAWMIILMQRPDSSMHFVQQYLLKKDDIALDFDVDEVEGVYKEANVDDAFYALYHLMQKGENDVPWNKARFEINNEGDFEMEFKLDEDFAWYKSLDIDNQEYDDLDIDIIDQIKTWKGLPKEYVRYWSK